MLGPQIGMGPIWLQKPDSKLLRCSELHTEPCDPVPTDQCCAVIPCKYCLKILQYGVDEENAPFGVAEFDTDAWFGIVDGHSVVLYWRRNEYTGACEFAVLFDGEEVAALDCSEGSCRDSSGAADIGGDKSLVWERQLSHPLQYRKGEDGCTEWFCGDCECTCKELCAKVTLLYNGRPLTEIGTLAIDPYLGDCAPPIWTGNVQVAGESVYISLHLFRGEYDGLCYLAGEIRGESVGPVLIDDCKRVGATFTLYDGSEVEVYCKECGCDVLPLGCTQGCCFPHEHNTPLGDVILPMPFSVDAPNCYEADGYQGVFQPIGIGFNAAGRCGGCNYYESDDQIAIQAQGKVSNGVNCLPSPVELKLCFGLECRNSDEGKCCENLMLVVGSIYPFSGATYEPDSPFGSLCPWVRRIAPTTCMCNDEDGFPDHDKNGFSAVYSLDGITFTCDETYSTGPCAGQPVCPSPLNCSFAGATLSI